MSGKNLLLRVMRFIKLWSHVLNHYSVKSGVHRTCGIGDIAFFIYHEITYSHVIKELFDFGHGDQIP